MRQRKEVLVGFFISIGIGLIIYASFVMHGTQNFITQEYTVEALFTNSTGIHQGSPIYISGVEVGRVQDVQLDSRTMRARVYFSIRNTIHIPIDSIVRIKNAGILGGKYIELIPGSSSEFVQAGDELFETQSPLDLEDLISKFVFGIAKSKE